MKRKKIKNAYEITDARISFVSLVDKAANQRQFLITKAENGKATFSTYGRILKADAETHFVTGIVYEPMVEDSHGNYMTEAEITKAAYWFAKNGDKVDLQHSFEPLPGATVVENWIAKADFQIGEDVVKKGTWLMTVEVTDEAVWDGILKHEITGLSMGGIGNYSEEDTDLDTVEKGAPGPGEEKRGLLAKFAEMLGFKTVVKGELAEIYAEKSRGSLFWNAFYTLEDCLYHWDNVSCTYKFETDETKVRDCLSDFNAIVTDLLTNENSITAALSAEPIQKAGRKMSDKNLTALTSIHDNLGAFIKSFSNDEPQAVTKEAETIEKEETEVTETEIKAIAEAVVKAMNPAPAAAPAAPAAPAAETPINSETIEKMVAAAVQKAMPAAEAAPAAPETPDIQAMIDQAVAKAMEPILKSRGLPTNLNDTPAAPVKKSEEHYLHGIL